MTALASIAVAVLVTVAIYMMLSRNTQRVVIGFIIMGNGVNLLVITSTRMPEGAVPPLIDPTAVVPPIYTDPLPQAFVLTAIVIGLGTAAFLLAMAARAHRELGDDELPEAEPS